MYYSCSRWRWNDCMVAEHHSQTQFECDFYFLTHYDHIRTLSQHKYKRIFFFKQPVPSVAVIPLGTGNDLSRVLGWGKEHDKHLDPIEVLEKIQVAEEVKLDRYEVKKKKDMLLHQ